MEKFVSRVRLNGECVRVRAKNILNNVIQANRNEEKSRPLKSRAFSSEHKRTIFVFCYAECCVRKRAGMVKLKMRMCLYSLDDYFGNGR